MGLRNLALAIEPMPDEGMVTVRWIREQLEEDDGAAELVIDLTVEEAARVLKRSPSTVRNWCAARRLEAYRLMGREWRIPPASIRAFMKAQAEAFERRKLGAKAAHKPYDITAWRKANRG